MSKDRILAGETLEELLREAISAEQAQTERIEIARRDVDDLVAHINRATEDAELAARTGNIEAHAAAARDIAFSNARLPILKSRAVSSYFTENECRAIEARLRLVCAREMKPLYEQMSAALETIAELVEQIEKKNAVYKKARRTIERTISSDEQNAYLSHYAQGYDSFNMCVGSILTTFKRRPQSDALREIDRMIRLFETL